MKLRVPLEVRDDVLDAILDQAFPDDHTKGVWAWADIVPRYSSSANGPEYVLKAKDTTVDMPKFIQSYLEDDIHVTRETAILGMQILIDMARPEFLGILTPAERNRVDFMIRQAAVYNQVDLFDSEAAEIVVQYGLFGRKLF